VENQKSVFDAGKDERRLWLFDISHRLRSIKKRVISWGHKTKQKKEKSAEASYQLT